MRGRKPGQLLGSTYNVVPKQQLTVSFNRDDLQVIEEEASALDMNRSKLLRLIIEEWVKNRKK
tara:strand:- start:59 stop:247 length:189 start_codon:yes stop_codon:yes gene_type:complete